MQAGCGCDSEVPGTDRIFGGRGSRLAEIQHLVDTLHVVEEMRGHQIREGPGHEDHVEAGLSTMAKVKLVKRMQQQQRQQHEESHELPAWLKAKLASNAVRAGDLPPALKVKAAKKMAKMAVVHHALSAGYEDEIEGGGSLMKLAMAKHAKQAKQAQQHDREREERERALRMMAMSRAMSGVGGGQFLAPVMSYVG